MVSSTNAYTQSCSTTYMPFCSVPTEIMTKIFAFLDWRPLVLCSGVCRTWRDFIWGTPLLQYKIELGADGLIDGPPGGLSVRNRLSLLLERRRAWRYLDFKRVISVPTPGKCYAYELVGGIFAKAMNTTTLSLGPRHFSFISLPTGLTEERTLVREDVGLTCRDFSIDPTQDLIAFVEQHEPRSSEVCVHLRTLSANKEHPSAAIPILKQPLAWLFEGAIIQIAEDVVSLFLLIQDIPRLLVWQWTTGKLLVNETNEFRFRFVDDFSLVSPNAFMVTKSCPKGAIDIYTFRSKDKSVCQNGVSAAHCVSLLLPELKEHTRYDNFTSHTAPFTAHIPEGKPFYTSEESRIHVMTIKTISRPGSTVSHMGDFVIIVPNRVLLKYANGSMSGTEFLWEEWGPRNTCWFQERYVPAWMRYVHGSKFVRAMHTGWPNMRCRLQVLDFSVHPLRPGDNDSTDEIAAAAEPDIPCHHRYVAGPTRTQDPFVFEKDVVSYLPYREVTTKAEFPYSGFMIDDQRVIGLSAMAFAYGDMKRIDVFTL